MKNRLLLQRIGYTVAGLAAISVAGGWRAGLAAFGATLILRRMLIIMGAHLGIALAHFRPEQLRPEDLPPARPMVRERVERPGIERPPAKPRGAPPAAPPQPQPPEKRKRHGAEPIAGEEKGGQLQDLVSVEIGPVPPKA